MPKDIIIVGGGISGLYLAHKLVKNNQSSKITILERSDRLGGHILTHYETPHIKYETGAGRFNKYHKNLLRLLKDYNLGISPIANTKKAFRPLLCTSKPTKNRSDEYIQAVLDYSKMFSKSFLQKITFGQLCNTAIGYKKTRELVASFGYNAEFLIANAYTSVLLFREDFNGETPYYVCTAGLSALIAKMEADLISKGVIILKNHTLTDFKDGFTLRLQNERGQTRFMKADRLVLAIPKEALMAFDFFKDAQKTLFESVEGVNLHRIYAKYKDTRWLTGVGRTTTDLQLRQFIPVNSDKGVAMISYSDTTDADFWKTYADAGQSELEKELERQLRLVFPKTKISKTEWVRSYFWSDAVHCWKAGVNPTLIRTKIEKIHQHLHIIGESYSMHQGWIEGALETANRIYPQIL